MNTDEKKEEERYFYAKLRGTKDLHQRFLLLGKRCGYRCQATGCQYKHLCKTDKGPIILSESWNGKSKPILKCQFCSFEDMRKLVSVPIKGKKTTKKPIPGQLSLL